MKFACPNCKTRYSIADEKLPSGASVKFRCKTCDTSIRLKRKAEGKSKPAPQEMEDSASAAESTRVAPLGQLQELRRRAAEEEKQERQSQSNARAPSAPEPMSDNMAATAVVSLNQLNELRSQSSRTAAEPEEWYVLVSGEQRGPVAVSAIRDMLERKEITERSFVWMNGMPDWKRIQEVAQLRELAGSPKAPAAPKPAAGASFNDSTAMMDASTLQEHIAQARAQEPAQPTSMFDERTATMSARELEAQVAEMRDPGARAGDEATRGGMFNDSTAMMDVNTLQEHIAQARAPQSSAPAAADSGEDIGFDGPEPISSEPTPAGALGDDATVAEMPRERMRGDTATLPGTPESLAAEATEASHAAELEPGSTPFSDEVTNEEPLPEIGESPYPPEEAGFRVDTDEAQAPNEFHKARTMVQPISDIAAAANLAGEPTGEGMSRSDVTGPGQEMSLEAGGDPFGSLDAPFGGPDDELESFDSMPSLDDSQRASGEYHDAPPGEQTRVFMATAGIFKRRRNNMISAVIGTIFLLVFSGVITLDVMGIYTIPGMGIAYDLTGFEDPNKDRAIERTKEKLQTANDPEERKRLQQKLLGLGGEPPARRGRGTKRGGKKSDTVTEGIQDDTDLSDEKKSLAGSLFEDDRKSGAAPKLKAPEEIATADLPDGLTQEAIQKVISEKQSSMKLCLTEAYRKGEKLAGRMEVQITIDATGKVTEAVVNTDQYKSSSMGQCTVKRVQTWKFPRFNGDPVTVVFPYVLAPGL